MKVAWVQLSRHLACTAACPFVVWILARALQALSDPYYQSSVCLSVCLSATLMLNVSETE